MGCEKPLGIVREVGLLPLAPLYGQATSESCWLGTTVQSVRRQNEM